MKTVFLVLVVMWSGYKNGIYSDCPMRNEQNLPKYYTDEIEVNFQEEASFKILEEYERKGKKVIEAHLYLNDLNEPSRTEIGFGKYSISEYKEAGISRVVCPKCHSRNTSSGRSFNSDIVKSGKGGNFYHCIDCKNEFVLGSEFLERIK